MGPVAHVRSREISIKTVPGRHRARIPGIWPKLWWISISSRIPTTRDVHQRPGRAEGPAVGVENSRISTKLWPDAQNPCPRYEYLPGPGTCSCLSVRGMSWTRSLRLCLFSGFSVVLPRFPPPAKQCYRFSKSGVPLSVRERPIVRQAVQVACPPPPSPFETLHHVVVIQTPADGPIPVCLLLTPCPEGLRSLSG